jgi:hypothetical protein
MKSLKEKIKIAVLSDVLDAFPDEIMNWWIDYEEKKPKTFIFDPSTKILIDCEDLSLKEASSIEHDRKIKFILEPNFEILENYWDACLSRGNRGLVSCQIDQIDLKEVKEMFWSTDVDEIFCEHQGDFEDAIELALEPFFEENAKLLEVYADARDAYVTLKPYFKKEGLLFNHY